MINNSAVFITALDLLTDCFTIRHIRISAYNSCTNGIIEQQHRTIQESIVKACKGNISCWPAIALHAFWADHVTTCKATGHTPYYIQLLKKPSQCLAILESLTWHKSNKSDNILKIIYIIV